MSDYRDDREALHARNAALEEALADKQRELDALKQNGASHRSAPVKRDHGDGSIPRLIRRAWVGVAGFAMMLGVSLGFALMGRPGAMSIALLVATAASGAVAVVLAGRPLRQRTGFDVDFMVSRVWLVGLLGLVIPPVALIDAFLRLGSNSVGGYQTTKENGLGGTAYPEVALPMGEGRPLGVALLLIATAWPAAVACAVFADRLFAR